MFRRSQPGEFLVRTPWTLLEKVLLVLIFVILGLTVAIVVKAQEPEDPRVLLGLVPPEILEGSRLFFRETFEGNGRTCGTCHLAEDNLTIEPSTIARLAPTDPLFVRGVPDLERLDLLPHGLIQENVDGLGKAPLFRSVPHTLSLATSIHTTDPDQPPGTEPVGWSGDGAPGDGTLRSFAAGAVIQHFTKDLARRPGIDFRLPTSDELDAMLAFQMSLGRTEDLDLAAARMVDPAAERGRLMMLDTKPINCGRCHGNAGANRGDGSGLGNQSKDTGVDALRIADLPRDDGRGSPGDEQFSPPPLIEAADTAPFFHVNTVTTLEDAIRFYTTPTFTGSVQTFGEAGVQDLAALLRALNASLNAQMAVQRLDAALIIGAFYEDDPTVTRLLELAKEEAEDGVAVLTVPAMSRSRADLLQCATWIEQALRSDERVEKFAEKNGMHEHQIDRYADQRAGRIEFARTSCVEADQGLGTGLAMKLGVGNLAM